MLDSAVPAISFKWLSQRTEMTNTQYPALYKRWVHAKGAKQYFSKFPCPPALQWGYWLLLLNIWFPAAAQVILPVSSYILKLVIYHTTGSYHKKMQNGKKNIFGKNLIPEMTEVGITFFFWPKVIYFYFHIILIAVAEHDYGNFHLKE